MNKMSTPVRLLYYLNLSKDNEVMRHITHDIEAFNYFISVCELTNGSANAKQLSKKILKRMKKAV